ncbi:MAG: molybdenum cofactor biosynthesis protein MoaE [Acidimicrobiia bacterium]
MHAPTAPPGPDWVALGPDPLPVTEATAWATVSGAGAVVTFLGVVRDHADGRTDVTALTYEAYESEALRIMGEIVAAARLRWPEIARLALLHRLGTLTLTEASVAVVVSSAHRGVAFEAAQFTIDTLKDSVPIWKQEHWSGGADWGTRARDVRALSRNDGS